MAFTTTAFIADQFEDFPNYWLKFYEPGTTTPKSMATDATGGTLIARAEISAGGTVPIGFIKTAGDVILIPFVEDSYDAWIFPTAAEADADDTTNAERIADNISGISGAAKSSNSVIYRDTVSDVETDAKLKIGDRVRTLGHETKADGGDNTYEIVAAGTGTHDNGRFIDLSGSGLQARGTFPGGLINAAQFGADISGVADSRLAFARANIAGDFVVSEGVYKISSNMTITSNINYLSGSSLSMDTGVIVTTSGEMTALKTEQVFSGLGTAVSTRGGKTTAVYAMWFGVPQSDEAGEYTSELQMGIDFAQELGVYYHLPERGEVGLAGALTMKHGKGAGDTYHYHALLEGHNTQLFPDSNGVALSVVPRSITGTVGGTNLADIFIKDLFFNGKFITSNSRTLAKALVIGKAGFDIGGFYRNKVENIVFSQYLTIPMDITMTRHIDFYNMTSRDFSGGVDIGTFEDGFTGDMTFVDCEFQGTPARPPIKIRANTASGTARVKGLRFRDCVTYGSGSSITVGQNGFIGDSWWDDCAWDGPNALVGETALTIFGHTGGTFTQLFFIEPYFVSYQGRCVIVQTDDTAVIEGSKISGGRFSNNTSAGDSLIKLQAVEQFTVEGVHFYENTATSGIEVGTGCQHCVVDDNNDQNSSLTNLVSVGGAGTDNFKITGNVAVAPTVVVNDFSTPTAQQLVTNNLQMTA